MEIIKEKNITGDPHTILKPSLEETVGGNDLGSVVVTTTVVEKTEVSVVKIVQQEGEFIKNQEAGEQNEKEGLFGKLVDEDEGLKVNCSENGTSLAMDENGSYEKPVFEWKSHVENAIRDPMDICSSEGNEKKGGNRAEFVGSMEDMNKKDDETVDHDEEEDDHNFVVGDFVWGKIKSHPWWPGQIYDPNDASNYAAALRRKGRVLVAYFGDSSFSWCSPSQLKPFIENFQEMSRQSDSKKFVNAVQMVLKEVSRCVKVELMCKCQTSNAVDNAGVINSGIKEGSRVPKGNTIKVLMDRLEPGEVVSTLKGYATMEPGSTMLVELEVTVVKSCLSAFYGKKGGYLLVDYHDPKCIEGLEEETRSGGVVDSDIVGPLESPENGDDKLYQKRKQKSVAELLGEDESKVKKAKMSKDGGVMKERKRKVLVVSVTPESDHEEGGGGGGEDETMSPRQRKKSRYLSPPYLSPIGSGRLSVLGSGSGSFKEPKTEPEKVPEMGGEPLEDSLKKSSGKRTRERRCVPEGSDSQEHKEKADGAANVLNGLLRAARDPSSFVEKEKNLPTITELVSAFRSSVFKEGSRNPTGGKTDGEERLVLAFVKRKLEWMSEMVQMCEESEMNADVKASLEGGIQEVLEKVVKMRGK